MVGVEGSAEPPGEEPGRYGARLAAVPAERLEQLRGQGHLPFGPALPHGADQAPGRVQVAGAQAAGLADAQAGGHHGAEQHPVGRVGHGLQQGRDFLQVQHRGQLPGDGRPREEGDDFRAP